MRLEFHQLDRRHEHLRVRHPQRQRQLLASLASAGQQTPIIVVAVAKQPDHYLVIDGYKRIAALEQLGRDTVEAALWSLSEVQALVLDRSLHWSERESTLEEGWLLAELEQRFGYGLESNFLAGRTFSSWPDLNGQARQWCDRVNSTYKKHIRAVPRELFALEQRHLKPLPAWIPEVYRLQQRTVDVEGYVALHSNRYSVPVAWVGRPVEVRETKDKIEIQLDARNIASHERIPDQQYQRITLAAHRPPRGQGLKRTDAYPEEQAILQAAPEIVEYVAALKQHSRKLVVLALRQLLRLVREYPREPFLFAVQEAAHYGLYDLDRLERMILRRVQRDFFRLDEEPGDE